MDARLYVGNLSKSTTDIELNTLFAQAGNVTAAEVIRDRHTGESKSSRCPYALECALRLFVYCFNSRQLYKQRYPDYPAHVIDFLSPLL